HVGFGKDSGKRRFSDHGMPTRAGNSGGSEGT
ncbi:unnamed protein product, partial [marine sediment metagenome]